VAEDCDEYGYAAIVNDNGIITYMFGNDAARNVIQSRELKMIEKLIENNK